MPVQTRRPPQNERLRQDILEAARELFIHEGYESVSMRRLAEKIEYSPTTIYLYFKDKSDLLQCLTEETFGRMLQRQEQLRATHADPQELLRHLVRAYIEFGLENPTDYRITFLMPAKMWARPEDHLRPGSNAFKAFDGLRQAVAECMRQKRLRKLDLQLASQILWSGAHGLTSLQILFPSFPWHEREKLIGETVETLLRGLAAD